MDPPSFANLKLVLNGALAELGELPSRETLPATFDVPADTSADNQVSELFFS